MINKQTAIQKYLDAEEKIQQLEQRNRELVDKIRLAFAEYKSTEGCSCCRDSEGHEKAENMLGELLNAKPYDDGSGYDFRESAPAGQKGGDK